MVPFNKLNCQFLFLCDLIKREFWIYRTRVIKECGMRECTQTKFRIEAYGFHLTRTGGH